MQENQDEELKQRLYFITFILNSNEAIKRSLKILSPDENIGYKICVGLLTKFYKLFNSISKNLQEGDGTATDILVRPIYETGLTLQYLIIKWDKSLFEEFVLTDAMRRRDMIEFYENHPIFKHENKAEEMKKIISEILKGIKEDGLKLEDLPKQRPFSWHRKISYKKMASELGEEAEAIFIMVYSVGSLSVHPSWHEIKRLHITKEKDGDNFIPNTNIYSRPVSTYAFIICLALTICELYAKRFGDKFTVNYSKDLHQKLHKIFHRP